MTKLQLNLIAAACENMGIGINGTLPWKLKKEMSYFSNMTSTVSDNTKKNAVIMGRRTWECIPSQYKPLVKRLNIILTSNKTLQNEVPNGVVVVGGLDDAIKYIEGRDDVESTWVIGGSSVYKAAMEHPNCGKVYLTEIQKSYDCDTFFPKIPEEFKIVNDERVPKEEQVEGDIKYYYRVYKKM